MGRVHAFRRFCVNIMISPSHDFCFRDFGIILGPFWSPFGALWAPFGLRLSSLLHLGGTLVALCALWWCPLGFFSVPSGILVGFSVDFVAFSMDFKRMFLCFHGF